MNFLYKLRKTRNQNRAILASITWIAIAILSSCTTQTTTGGSAVAHGDGDAIGGSIGDSSAQGAQLEGTIEANGIPTE